jgi:ankyrin repeat protein
LLARGADPGVVDYHGHTPLFHAAERFHKDLFYLLLGRGAGATLREAALRGSAEEAERLLRQGADLNAGDKEGNTPLRRAAANCRYALAQLLIQHGADPNARNNQGKTPLDLLNCPGKMRVFKKLLAAELGRSGGGLAAGGVSGFSALVRFNKQYRWQCEAEVSCHVSNCDGRGGFLRGRESWREGV